MVVPAGGACYCVLLLLVVTAFLPLPRGLTSAARVANTTALQPPQQQTYSQHPLYQRQQQELDMESHGVPEDTEEEEEFGGDVMQGDQAQSFVSEDIQVGCRELRAKRYISDGFCTSTKPIKEVVCAGHCLPIMDLPWYAEFVKVWARSKLRDWQCEEDVVKRKSVHLLCRNGQYRTYRIKVVKSCKCKRVQAKHNRTVHEEGGKKKRRKGKKGKRRRGEKRKGRGRKRGRKNRKNEEKTVSVPPDTEEVEVEANSVDTEPSRARRRDSQGSQGSRAQEAGSSPSRVRDRGSERASSKERVSSDDEGLSSR